MSGPLEGVRVVDFSRVLAGPGCTAFLALLGAEVIRVGTSSKADYRDPGGRPTALNQAKRSCTLNLKHADARMLAARLSHTADLVVENFSAGVIDRLGLGFDELNKHNPRLSMLSISGFGREGAEAELVAYGSLLQAFTGWCSMVPGVELSPSDIGLGITPPWTDRATAMMAAIAAIAAISATRKTGRGVYIDVAMVDALNAMLTGAVDDKLDERDGQYLPPLPSGCYPARTGWVAVSCFTSDQWLRLGATIGDAQWAAELDDLDARHGHAGEIEGRIRNWLGERGSHEAAATLVRAGVPAAAAESIWDLTTDPVLEARGYYTGGIVPPYAGQPYTLSLPWMSGDGSRGRVEPGSQLGADTDDVLQELLGLSPEEIGDLRAAGALT